MKKILFFLLLPLFSFSQDRGCNWSQSIKFSYSVNDSIEHHSLYSFSAPFPVTVFSDTSEINVYQNDSLTFYYDYSEGGAEFSPFVFGNVPDTAISVVGYEGLIILSNYKYSWLGFCAHQMVNDVFTLQSGSNKIVLNYLDVYSSLTYNINRIEDNRDRNVNIKLSSNSSLNIATKKGNQTLKMFSMNGQLVYSYSFDAAEFAGVNISLPGNIFPSGIYILNLVNAEESRSYKVFVN